MAAGAAHLKVTVGGLFSFMVSSLTETLVTGRKVKAKMVPRRIVARNQPVNSVKLVRFIGNPSLANCRFAQNK